MPLETATYIHDLVPANPAHSDGVTQGDAHLRLIKSVLQNQFPNFTSVALNSTEAQIDTVVGLTSQINTNTSNVTTIQGQITTLNNAVLSSVAANLFYAAPNGSAGVPSWRNIVSADLHGTTTNDNAAAGIIGEYVEARVVQASGVNLTSAVASNIASITLSAGDWDVCATGCFYGTGTLSSLAVNSLFSSLSTTTGTMNFGEDSCAGMSWSGISNSNIFVGLSPTAPMTCNIPPKRFSLSGPTTIYLVSEALMTTGGVSAIGGYGAIKARRCR